MKVLFLTLALIAGVAQAQTYVAPNNAGGEIVLQNAKCDDNDADSLLSGYAYARDGSMRKLCWAIFDGLVHVVFLDDGQRAVFKPEYFTKRGEAKPQKKNDQI